MDPHRPRRCSRCTNERQEIELAYGEMKTGHAPDDVAQPATGWGQARAVGNLVDIPLEITRIAEIEAKVQRPVGFITALRYIGMSGWSSDHTPLGYPSRLRP